MLFAFVQEFSHPKTANLILFATKVISQFGFQFVKFDWFHIHIYTYIDLHLYTLAALYDNYSHLSTKYDNELILEIESNCSSIRMIQYQCRQCANVYIYSYAYIYAFYIYVFGE